MRTTILNRTTGAIAAALMLAGLSQPATAQDWRSQARAEMRYLADDNPGSAIVYVGCRAVAEDEYYQSGDLNRALGSLTACAGLGCAFTDSYSNCLRVGSRLFILELALS